MVKGLTPEPLQGAFTDEETSLPDSIISEEEQP